jgi:hypothetical protein
MLPAVRQDSQGERFLSKQSQYRVGEASPLRSDLSKQTHFDSLWPLCPRWQEKTKQTQISAFSVEKRTMLKKTKPNQTQKLSKAKSAATQEDKANRDTVNMKKRNEPCAKRSWCNSAGITLPGQR